MVDPERRGAVVTRPGAALTRHAGGLTRRGAGLRRRGTAFTLATALLTAACGSLPTPATSGPSPAAPTVERPTPPASPAPATGQPAATPHASPDNGVAAPPASPNPAALYRTIEDQVAGLRGLPLKQRLEPLLLTEADLRSQMAKQLQADNTPAELRTASETLQAIGLLSPGVSLEKLYQEMYGSQVAGFYDPKAKTIAVVARSGTIGAVEKVTFAHEFDHALQDQSFDLEGVAANSIGQGDRALARLAVVEGDATLLMSLWMTRDLQPSEMGDLLKGDPAAQAQLEQIPAILRETLLFPYTSGFGFVMNRWTAGGWPAVDAAYANLPVSTEQILHPEKYASGEQPASVSLDGPALARALGPAWKAAPTDTFGEFQLRVWLAARNSDDAPVPSASDAAAGWGGDRLVLLDGPSGAWAFAMVTAWDTAADAAEFQRAAVQAVAGLPGAATVVAVGRGVPGTTTPPRWAVLVASDADTLATLRLAVAPPVR